MIISGITDYGPAVMGILNITPDSFSGGGMCLSLRDAVDRAAGMVEEGADIIDVGGESTRPLAAGVSQEEELKRVIPVIKEIKNRLEVKVSCDTYKYKVAEKALENGAGMINDVTGFTDPMMRRIAAEFNAAVCIMHMQGNPRTMQKKPEYKDVLSEVRGFLYARAVECEEEGIDRKKIVIDPGIGFGKTLEHNLTILANIDYFTGKYPVLVGASGKSFLEKILDVPVEERLAGSLAVASYCSLKNVSILRVHDVKETRETVEVIKALKEKENG